MGAGRKWDKKGAGMEAECTSKERHSPRAARVLN